MKPYYSLSDFPDRKSAGKNFVAVCPKCGTPHLSISKAKGVYHCFYAGCNFNGILTDSCKADRPMSPNIPRELPDMPRPAAATDTRPPETMLKARRAKCPCCPRTTSP